MRDMVTELWITTGDLETIVDLDLHAFNTLFESHTRLKYGARIELANIARSSQMAEQKDFKKFLEPWMELIESEAMKEKRILEDAKKFQAKFGSGF